MGSKRITLTESELEYLDYTTRYSLKHAHVSDEGYSIGGRLFLNNLRKKLELEAAPTKETKDNE